MLFEARHHDDSCLTIALKKQRQVDLFEFEASPICISSSRSAWATKWNTIPPKKSMKILLIIYLVVNSYLEYKKEFKKINAHTNQFNQQSNEMNRQFLKDWV